MKRVRTLVERALKNVAAAVDAMNAAEKTLKKHAKGGIPDRYRCPVPRCRGKAAPVFGMVCSRHKDLPKMQITKYREALRAKRKAA